MTADRELRQGNYDAAIALFKESIKRENSILNQYVQLAKAYVAKRMYGHALFAIDQAIEEYGNAFRDLDLLKMRGELMETIYGSNNHNKHRFKYNMLMLQFYHREIQLDPDAPKWYWKRAGVYKRLGKYNKADEDIFNACINTI